MGQLLQIVLWTNPIFIFNPESETGRVAPA